MKFVKFQARNLPPHNVIPQLCDDDDRDVLLTTPRVSPDHHVDLPDLHEQHDAEQDLHYADVDVQLSSSEIEAKSG